MVFFREVFCGRGLTPPKPQVFVDAGEYVALKGGTRTRSPVFGAKMGYQLTGVYPHRVYSQRGKTSGA